MSTLTNALGEPSPNRTDFKSWARETLEKFAREAADENLVLRTDVKAALAAWRQAVLVELTDEQIYQLAERHQQDDMNSFEMLKAFAREIEALMRGNAK